MYGSKYPVCPYRHLLQESGKVVPVALHIPMDQLVLLKVNQSICLTNAVILQIRDQQEFLVITAFVS
jgi:hypothetical protein